MTLSKKTKAELIAEVEKLQAEIEVMGGKKNEKGLSKTALKNSDWVSYFQHSLNYLVVIDMSRNIVDVNKFGPGGKKEDYIGVNVFSLVSEESKTIMKEAIDNLFDTQIPQRYHTSRVLENSEVLYYSSLIIPIVEDNKVVAAIIEATDVTNEIKINNELKESEEKYRTLVDIFQDAIFVNLGGLVKYANPAALKLFGAVNQEQLIGKTVLDLYHPDYHKLIKQRIETMRSTNMSVSLVDEKIIQLDGTVIDVEVVATPFILSGEQAIYVVLRDISYRKKMESLMKMKEQNSLLERHAELVPGLIFQYQVFPDGRFMFPFASSKIWDTLELTAEEVKYDASMAFNRVHADDKENVVQSIKQSMKTLEDWDQEFRVNLPTKGMRWLSGHAKPEKLEDGSFLWHGYYHDITERKIIIEQISHSLQEKDVLLKEVHHRVKNNLQVISSILNLQSSYVKDEATLNVLRESQNRIKSMAFIHESLYQADNFSSINFSDYVINLLQNLMQSYSKLNQTVKLNVDLQTVFLNLDLAIPCGLIINEIVSNALKYAFPENKEGDEIIIMMKTEGGDLKLVLGDNGVGLPKKIDYKNTESLGLQLVVTLVGQLNGSVELDNINGTKYTIQFPK